jgi:F-type H+-transporting ATPase subunit b
MMWNRILLILLAAAVGVGFAAPIFAAEQGPSEDYGLNPFAPSALKGDLALWTAVIFLILVAVLWKFAWGPLTAALDKRERHVADQIAQAEAANQRAKETLADHERKLAAAGEEVRSILEQGRRHAEQLSRELLDKAKHEAEAEHQRALRQIEAAADAAIKDLADQSAAMAVRLAGQILQAEIKPRDHARLINQAVAGFAQQKSDMN